MEKKAKVAFMTPYPKDEVQPLIDAAPPELDVYHVDNRLPVEAKIPQVRDAEFALLLPADISVDLVRACPKLRLIQLYAAGYDRIDVKGISSLGVPIATNGGSNATAVAEFTVALILNLYKRFIQIARGMAEGKWTADQWRTSHDLDGKTVGIVGMGSIGRKVAERLRAFHVELLGCGRSEVPEAVVKELGIRITSFEELLRKSDIVTLHVPLTPRTRAFIGKKELASMKGNAVLVNTSRGAVVDETALYEALRDKTIAGAALDVLEREPMSPDNPLRTLDNVIVTPHVASCTLDSRIDCALFCYRNVLRVLDGKEPLALVKV